MLLKDRNAINRRKFLGIGLATMAAAFLPKRLFAAAEDIALERNISFFNAHTHENLDIVFWKDGNYIAEALPEIDHIFRDTRTEQVKTISTDLLDLLFFVRQKLQCIEPFHIVSGYRTPKSNNLLRQSTKGVAKNSLHMFGKAVDLRLPGYSLKTLMQTVKSFRAGGVGYYPGPAFVHVDVGQVRYWQG